MVWYRVRFPKIGDTDTRKHALVEGESRDDARSVAADHEDFDGFDTENGQLYETDFNLGDVRSHLSTADGVSTAYTQSGDRLQKTDLISI